MSNDTKAVIGIILVKHGLIAQNVEKTLSTMGNNLPVMYINAVKVVTEANIVTDKHHKIVLINKILNHVLVSAVVVIMMVLPFAVITVKMLVPFTIVNLFTTLKVDFITIGITIVRLFSMKVTVKVVVVAIYVCEVIFAKAVKNENLFIYGCVVTERKIRSTKVFQLH